MPRLRIRRPLLALVALLLALAVGYTVQAARSDHHALSTTALSKLPPQVAQTIHLIESGGPFPYPRNDGAVFHNAEHRLPDEPDGYYHEYTVPTPGSPDRGARRVIVGKPGQYFYTADHYEHFVRVDVTR